MAPTTLNPVFELFVDVLAVLISVVPAYYAYSLYQRERSQKVWLVFAFAMLLTVLRRSLTLLDLVTPTSVYNGLDPVADTSIAVCSISFIGWSFWTLSRRYTIIHRPPTQKKPARKSRRGQGATEYIVLLAIVLMVALVVVGLLGFFPSFSSGTQANEGRSYWQTASPIAIQDALQVSGAGAVGSYVNLVLQNNAAYPITITALNITGATSGAQSGNATSVSLGAGASSTLWIVNNSAAGLINDAGCLGNSGKTVSYNVTITYNTATLSGKKQLGAKPLIVNCQ